MKTTASPTGRPTADSGEDLAAASDGEAAPGWPERDRSLIADRAGRIVFCRLNTAAFFGRRSADLLGQPVARVFPELPLCSQTPGYNLAFARLHGVPRNWIRLHARHADGSQVAVAVAIAALALAHASFIVFTIRLAAAAPCAAGDASGKSISPQRRRGFSLQLAGEDGES
jgi:hypothetical protein